MTHTPGPWIYSGKGYICGGECCVADTETYSATKKLSPPQRAANARLIAAAPELLEALKVIKNEVTEDLSGLDLDMAWGILHTVRDMAKEAIAKATGVDQ